MKRLRDYDEYRQGIPKHKPFPSLGERSARNPLYVTTKEFEDMQIELTEKLAEQTQLQEQLLIELKQIKFHLAVLSEETVESSDVGEK